MKNCWTLSDPDRKQQMNNIQVTIIKICAGELTPGVENQQKLADALHIDTEDLIFCSKAFLFDSETEPWEDRNAPGC